MTRSCEIRCLNSDDTNTVWVTIYNDSDIDVKMLQKFMPLSESTPKMLAYLPETQKHRWPAILDEITKGNTATATLDLTDEQLAEFDVQFVGRVVQSE